MELQRLQLRFRQGAAAQTAGDNILQGGYQGITISKQSAQGIAVFTKRSENVYYITDMVEIGGSNPRGGVYLPSSHGGGHVVTKTGAGFYLRTRVATMDRVQYESIAKFSGVMSCILDE